MDRAEAEQPAAPVRSRGRLDALAALGNRAAAHPLTIPLLLALAIGVIARLNHFQGVDWGDDFALYMRQAKAIAIGNVGEVLADNRFTVDNSGWHNFSPYGYPWGWPLIVSPIFAFSGLNYDAVKFLQVIALGVFVAFFFALMRRRLGTPFALLVTLVIALSPSFVGWSDTALSDLPYLAVAFATLWWVDRCRARGLLDGTPTAALGVLGLMVSFAFNVRREGAVLLLALAALQLTQIAQRAAGTGRRSRAEIPWRRVLVPHLTFLASAFAFHLLLPTALLPHTEGSGLVNVPVRLDYYKDMLAEQIGIKDFGANPVTLLNSPALGSWTLAALVALAGAGVVLRLARRPEEDVFLAVYMVGISTMILVAPYQDGRYLFSVTPLLIYFAFQALPEVGRLTGGKSPVKVGAALGAALLLVFLGANARDLAHSTRYHMEYDYIIHGPETPLAQQMFGAVRERTRPDDEILFFRARALTFYTDRRAIQGSNLEQLLPRVDWYAMEKGSTYSQRLLTDADAAGLGLQKVWENDGWVLWKVPRAGSA